MLKFSTVLIIAAIAVVVNCYDFKDSDFNMFLFEELEAELEDEPAAPILRHRRDVTETQNGAALAKKECNRRDYKEKYMCCQGDKVDQKLYEPFIEAKKQCYVEVRGNNADDSFDPFDCEKITKVKEQIVCVNECFAKKLNFLDEQGALKRDELLALVRKMIGEVQWKQDVSETIVDKCIAEVKTKREAATATGQHAPNGCNRCPLEFHHCLWREFSNGCPAELRIDTAKCNKIRERLTKGDRSILNKNILHFFHEKRHDDEVKASHL